MIFNASVTLEGVLGIFFKDSLLSLQLGRNTEETRLILLIVQ